MNPEYWLKQSGEPLYPQLEWSRPETRAQAGKLLIIGGNKFGFAAPAEAYNAAQKAGVGAIRVLLPESLRRAVGKLFPEAEFAPSTMSGSFARTSLAELIGASMWADGVLFPGDLSRNSETTVALESYLHKDTADLLCQQPISVLHRPETLLVLAMGQLQKLGAEAHFPRAFTSKSGMVQLVDALHEFTKRFAPHIITKHQGYYIAAADGQISTTKINHEQAVWRLQTAAAASVWWLQNPGKPLEALTTALYTIS
jgi:NAD(P)H-hydrate repair Nnr-like enzyme with NAD(P)H-hydrate dehydratase domain